MLIMYLSRSLASDLTCIFKHTYVVQKRCKHKKDHWSVLAKKKTSSDRALEHFDDFYKNVYGDQWPSIRLALLSPHKYCAVINNFGDSEKFITSLQNRGALNMRTLFELEKERLKHKKVEIERGRNMAKIFKLDKQMEMLMLSKQQQECESIYPPGKAEGSACESQLKLDSGREETLQDDITELDKTNNLSLKSSLDEAEIDHHRLIDPSSGLTTSALYEFVPATRLKGKEDWVLESEHYGYYKKSTDFPVQIKQEYDLHFPEALNIFTYERGNVSTFPSPRRASTGVLNHYLLDGGSVLPVLALDLRPGDSVLDMCAAPGGKSLLMLQTLYPGRLVCNDIQESRTKRIHSVLRQYLYNLEKWSDQLTVTMRDGRAITEQHCYNKILVDVPCTTDRHSLHQTDNNIFKQTRMKERLKLPEMQAQLLSSALKLVQPGGTVVYSTCTLSPIQNDGVVHMALRSIWEETDIKVEVRDLSAAFTPTRMIYRFSNQGSLRFGHLVVPFLPSNFGPIYFCKIVRTA